MNKSLFVSTFLCIAFFAACAGDATRGSDVAVRDSAGVRIVENTTPIWEPGEAWHLSPKPVLDIGTVEGDPDYELFRIGGAVRLSAGTIVVANGGSTELRYFDRQGRYLAAAGGQGGGPGEFGWVVKIFRMAGDSIGVDSGNPPRFQVFDADGRFIRSISRDRGRIHGVFPDGSVLVEELALDSVRGMERYLRPNVRLLRSRANGRPGDTVGLFPGTQALYRQDSEGRFLMAANRPFSRFTLFAVAADRILTADNAEYRVDTHDARGDWVSSIRRRGRSIPFTNDLLETWYRSLAGDNEAFVRRNMDNASRRQWPETVPAFQDILVDDVGNLWVQEYALRFGEPQRWTVFDQDRVLLGTMEMPPSFQPYHIGSDFVLGQYRDDLDIEHVQLYDLIKPER